MKWLLVVLVLLVVAVVGVGFYQGWFHLSTDNTDHHPSVKIEVDETKMLQDKKKVEGLGEKAKEDAAGKTDNTDNHPSVKIEVDETKIQQDKKKLEGLGEKAKEDAAGKADKVKDQEPRP